MIYVTHDQLEAMTLADRIAVLNGGHLQQFGAPEDLYTNPVNRFVAGFIGSPGMSFLERLEKGVVIGVRPHEVELHSTGIPATLVAVERLGFESYLHLNLNDGLIMARIEGPPPNLGPVNIRLNRSRRLTPRVDFDFLQNLKHGTQDKFC